MTTAKIDDLADQEAYLLAKQLKETYELSEEQAYWIVIDMISAGWKSPTDVGQAEVAARKEATASLKGKLDAAVKRVGDLEDELKIVQDIASADNSKIVYLEGLLLKAIGDVNQIKKRVDELEASKSNRINITTNPPGVPLPNSGRATWTTNKTTGTGRTYSF
ncbi:hypothetical protein QEH42_gp254 [Microbacterium phage Pumpernickel]|uniref:Uncharacterized protein n=1 Tax=Microbacterium phage Pumpernickel TaxID=2885983 RepID=A0AAE9C3I9_9CAUD|nr:hypothetical protein QEH42_gp254 [Microbacterium phage Pumpernickel]UDL15964.1 hypothetical protein SEA_PUMPERNICKEL_214 [Microbacterium phage Pumpernickel]